MRAAAALVGMKIIAANQIAGFFRHEHLVPIGKPVAQRLVSIPVARQRISFAGPQDWFENGPDRICVGRCGGSNGRHGQEPAWDGLKPDRGKDAEKDQNDKGCHDSGLHARGRRCGNVSSQGLHETLKHPLF
jgi:hypothetical protein